MASPPKAAGAFRTIGEVAVELGVAQHVLRYWETRFTQLRPLQRAGNRRYYRPEDVALARRIDELLNAQGYTVKGVQQLLAREDGGPAPVAALAAPDAAVLPDLLATLEAIRVGLSEALHADGERDGS
ncbi:MerR family transcriptional regulator [uncultured Sphingomonas sp.]|uniref:MerR family transcriptional regulator n=1 Tax=uncultured Sphingomonas sp. TaxID=158754 RepID=UPI0035CBCB30